jgi:hypothetical protein
MVKRKTSKEEDFKTILVLCSVVLALIGSTTNVYSKVCLLKIKPYELNT